MLAAGGSVRMEGRHKLLLPFGDGPVIRRPVEAALAAGLSRVAVIVGGSGGEVAACLADLPAETIENPGYDSGIAGSVNTALDWAEPRADALVLLLGDEPAIDPDVIRRALARWAGDPLTPHRVKYADRPGHPVIVPLPVPSSRRPSGDSGLGELLAGAIELEVPAPAPIDVDTRSDYLEALARLRQ